MAESTEGAESQSQTKKKTRKCRAACKDQANTVAVTTSRLPNRQTFTERPEFCALLKKLRNKCSSQWNRDELDFQYPQLCSLIKQLEDEIR